MPDKAERRAALYKKRQLVIDGLKNRPCMDCGGRFPPECMDFDHRDPSTKNGGVAQMWAHKMETLLAEIALCDLVCANCHRIRTRRNRAR
jgi:hypothetical protein